MSITLTALANGRYGSNALDGIKRVYYSCSGVNPYTTGGESLTNVSTDFKVAFYGGKVLSVGPSVSAVATAIFMTSMLKGDSNSCGNPTSSTAASAPVLQLFNTSIAAGGYLSDNTISGIMNNGTFVLEVIGR